MQVQVIYSSPIVHRQQVHFQTSFLERSGTSSLGILSVEYADSRGFKKGLRFFQVDMQYKDVTQQHVVWQSSVNDIQLCYDEESKHWIACLGNSLGSGTLVLYGINPQQKDWFTELVEVASEYHFVPLRLITMNKWRDRYHIVYLVGSIDEVSDLEVYWSIYKDDSFEKVTSSFISYCDTATSFQLDDHFLLFFCNRIYQEEPLDAYPRAGFGQWQLSLRTYTMESKLVSERFFLDESVSIRDSKDPHRDLSNWLDIRISVTEGPKQSRDEKPTCVAAMILYEATELPKSGLGKSMKNLRHHTTNAKVDGRQHGGLFWLDYQGSCLQQSTSPVGTQISMCCCGDHIIGADRLFERRRLWVWFPVKTKEVQECLILDSTSKRATVLSHNERHFWLLEEHENGVRVSLRESITCIESSTIWLEGLSLPDGPSGRYFYDQRKPAGVISYENTLLILGLNIQKQLLLFQVTPDI